MVGMPVRSVRAAVNVEPWETGATTVGEVRMSEPEVEKAAVPPDKVIKPAAQPARPAPVPRGGKPVTKAGMPQQDRRQVDRRDIDRQKVKLLIQRPEEREVLDKVLQMALDAGTLTPEESDLVGRIILRSKARRW